MNASIQAYIETAKAFIIKNKVSVGVAAAVMFLVVACGGNSAYDDGCDDPKKIEILKNGLREDLRHKTKFYDIEKVDFMQFEKEYLEKTGLKAYKCNYESKAKGDKKPSDGYFYVIEDKDGKIWQYSNWGIVFFEEAKKNGTAKEIK